MLYGSVFFSNDKTTHWQDECCWDKAKQELEKKNREREREREG